MDGRQVRDGVAGWLGMEPGGRGMVVGKMGMGGVVGFGWMGVGVY